MDGTIALLWAASAIVWMSVPAFTYWDLEGAGLREHRPFWKTKTIPWSEVTYIGPWESASSKRIAIEYERKAPFPDRGRIIATPARRQAFIAALRRFAPQAEFEI